MGGELKKERKKEKEGGEDKGKGTQGKIKEEKVIEQRKDKAMETMRGDRG